MSTVLSDPSLQVAAPSRRRNVPEWLREPLLHFVLLGGLLFAADYFVGGRSDDPHTIVIDAKVDQEARQIFQAARGREPNAEELYALRRVWLDNEVLYREGLALQLDKGDKSIRERVIFKALSVVDAGTKLPPYDDKLLREWFEKNRTRYDEPPRYSFQEAVLSGNADDAAKRAFASALNAGNPGDARAGLRVFRDRPHDNIVQTYGETFARALEILPPGEWRALQARDELRVMQLSEVSPPKPADYEELRGVVLQDWTDATLAEQRSDAVRVLAKKYTVKVAGEEK